MRIVDDRHGSMHVSAGTSILAVYAAANLAVGIALALTQPLRADDVWIVFDWCRGWLLHGQQLYAGVDARTDYPPNAIVLFSPLALVPRQLVVPAWTAFTLLLTPLYAYVVIKVTSPRTRAAAAVAPMLLFFCWGGVRTFLEFSRLSLTLGFLAVLAADANPVASGVSLGLALAKPQIAGPIMLWALVTKRMRVAAIAVAVVAIGWAVYCIHTRAGPIVVARDYWRVLLSLYSGAEGVVGRRIGLTSLREWWLAAAGDTRLGAALWAVGAGLLLLVPCAMATRRTDRPDRRSAAVLALFCLCSLLTVSHIGNNLSVLMLPSFVFLLMLDDPATAWWRRYSIVAIQAAMMLDIPVHLAAWVSDHGIAFVVVRDFDRVIVVLTFVAVVAASLEAPLSEVHFVASRLRRSAPIDRQRWLWSRLDPVWHDVSRRFYSRFGSSTDLNGDLFTLSGEHASRHGHHDRRCYEPLFYGAFTQAVQPGMCVFDVGADIGIFTLGAAKRVGAGCVFAFEPDPQRASIVERHVRLNHWQTRARVIASAVSDRDGRAPFYATAWTMAGSLSRENAEIAGENQRDRAWEREVETVSLDRFCDDMKCVPDVLKIDAEGAELLVLRGARNLLSRTRPIIFCEVHPLQMRNCGSSLVELETFLSDAGYVLEPLDGPDSTGVFHARMASR